MKNIVIEIFKKFSKCTQHQRRGERKEPVNNKIE